MPRKKDGMLFEVHPSPAKGKDGKNSHSGELGSTYLFFVDILMKCHYYV